MTQMTRQLSRIKWPEEWKVRILPNTFFINYISFYQLAKLMLEEKCSRAVAVAKLNKQWNSDDNLKNGNRHNEEPGIKLKTCPKSRIKRRVLMMEKTSYVMTRMKYQSSCYLDQKQRRWSLWVFCNVEFVDWESRYSYVFLSKFH